MKIGESCWRAVSVTGFLCARCHGRSRSETRLSSTPTLFETLGLAETRGLGELAGFFEIAGDLGGGVGVGGNHQADASGGGEL